MTGPLQLGRSAGDALTLAITWPQGALGMNQQVEGGGTGGWHCYAELDCAMQSPAAAPTHTTSGGR